MNRREVLISEPLVIRTGQDFDGLGVRDSEDRPYTRKRLLTMSREDIQNLLVEISGVIGISYQEPFLNDVLPITDPA